MKPESMARLINFLTNLSIFNSSQVLMPGEPEESIESLLFDLD